MEIKDEEIRRELSKILECYKTEYHSPFNGQKPSEILSWIEIAYEIGKLKQDEKN